MNFKDLYKTLERNKYYIFSYEDILSFYPDERRESLKKTIYRWKKKGWIYPLKRGLYELTYPKDFNTSDMYIANKLYGPSYVSLETALSNYSLIPEVSMAVTSITTKPTRRFKNKHGLFIYRTVKPKTFTGYYVERHGTFNVLIAEPEKALIDYLYFKTYRHKRLDLKDERLDKDMVLQLNKKKLNRYAAIYHLNLEELYAYL
ncbi:type IV toxin-antitoxin system AbiEi family antitoxin domain-containing protein [bacterium]|nr:type IV toxin-antitoxin system AbiEi family antitoxin domain-containing protein [bacterium]MBU1487054.1 type IV toxin-antitoxin system AbiEi family antitoxin domain-containing protein [bacterium]